MINTKIPEMLEFEGYMYRKYKVCATRKKADLFAGDLRNLGQDVIIDRIPNRDQWIVYTSDLKERSKGNY